MTRWEDSSHPVICCGIVWGQGERGETRGNLVALAFPLHIPASYPLSIITSVYTA